MSWKSLVCAGLVCVLASPVLAAPGLSVTNGGLDANGDWIWNVSVDPDDSMFTNPPMDNPDRGLGGSVAVELGFTAGGSALVSATPNTTNFDEDENPLTPIPGFPTGDGVQVAGNNISAALGSDFFGSLNFGGTHGDAKQMLTIITEGPSTTGSLTSSITVLGAYGGNGRIAQSQLDQTPPSLNFDIFAGMATRTVIAGDANLDNAVDLLDLDIMGSNFNQPGTWAQTDFNGDGNVDLLDLDVLGANFNTSGGTNTPLIIAESGTGVGAAVGVPEPASIALAGLGLLAVFGLARRR